jgi:FdhD protein
MTVMAKKTEVAGTPAASLCSAPVEGVAQDAEDRHAPVSWQLPEEVAVALQINSAPYTVMMATPADLTDFGVGFALAEGIVTKRSDIRAVLAMPVENGFAVDIAVGKEALERARMVRRSIEGRSGCGLCGVENIADVVRVTKPVATLVRPSPAAEAGTDVASGFVMMTSRCSFELVQKVATVGIGALVAVSAPTLLALEIARKARLFLASLGDRGVVVFNS